jgi:hypothetical protein
MGLYGKSNRTTLFTYTRAQQEGGGLLTARPRKRSQVRELRWPRLCTAGRSNPRAAKSVQTSMGNSSSRNARKVATRSSVDMSPW